MYYYTAAKPDGSSAKPHSTLFRGRPGEQIVEAPKHHSFRGIVGSFLPPIVVKAAKAVRSRL
jgi:hypothetical protein